MAEEGPSIMSHVSIGVSDLKRAVAFYDAALAAGASDDGPPGPRPLYGDPYYGAFVLDLDGHKIEAAYWNEEAGDHA